jgi:uncharacterized oxidoreductase
MYINILCGNYLQKYSIKNSFANKFINMFTNKTILVTGGGSGIGEAFATGLSKNNKVIICGRNEEKLRNVVATNKNLSYFVADVSVPNQIDTLFENLAAKGIVLDVLFNNAGMVELYEVMKPSLRSAQIFEKINTNLSGAIAVTQLFINQANKNTENIIVNITSSVAIFPFPILALYSSSKAGLSVFTKILRQQLKGTTFRVVEVLPAQVETEMPKTIGSTAKGEVPIDFVKKVIKKIESGNIEYSPGFNVLVMKFFSKFLPKVGLNIMDKISRKIMGK